MASGGRSFQISGLWTAYPQSKCYCAHPSSAVSLSHIGYCVKVGRESVTKSKVVGKVSEVEGDAISVN